MPSIRIILDDDPTNRDFQEASELLKGKEIVKGSIATIGALPGGMSSGNVSVYIQLELEDGRVAFAETSLGLLQMATAAFTGKYGVQEDGGPKSPSGKVN